MHMCVKAMKEMREIFMDEMQMCRSFSVGAPSAWHGVQPISEDPPNECEDSQELDSVEVEPDGAPDVSDATIAERMQLSEVAESADPTSDPTSDPTITTPSEDAADQPEVADTAMSAAVAAGLLTAAASHHME